MKNIEEIKNQNIRWINISYPDQSAIQYLKEHFPFHPLDLEDCLKPAQRPKIDQYPDYIFMILLFPVYNRSTREIHASEVYFFVTRDTLITLHRNNLPHLKDLYYRCQTSERERNKYLNHEIDHLLYEILQRLLGALHPMLDHISIDSQTIEKEIFSGKERKMVQEILITRRNITDFRKIMQAHKNTLKKLMCPDNEKILALQKYTVYYDDLVDQTKEIWDHLDNLKETIETLYETNESLISFRLNDIMKTLTMISVITFPITFIAALFGMNVIDMPIVGQPYDFWIIFTIILGFASTMILFYKRKRWL